MPERDQTFTFVETGVRGIVREGMKILEIAHRPGCA
jgi:hypothetical protein